MLQSGHRTIPEGPTWIDKLPAAASACQNECQEPARWFTQTRAGVSPDRAEPGFKHVLLRPRIPSRLPSASLVTTTPYGKLESSWKQQDGKVKWTVRIPANSHATAWIPASDATAIRESGGPLAEARGCRIVDQGVGEVMCRLASGNYTFEFPLPINQPSRLGSSH
jgi:alpha-L-rhamnosidase